MDDEQRKYFADLMASNAGIAADSRAAAASSHEALQVARRVEGRVEIVEGQIVVLNRHVFGSKPPPTPPVRPMAHSVTEHDGDIAEVRGQLLAVQSELERQSKKMGIDAAGIWRFVHNTKVQDVVKLATLAAAFYAAWKGLK